MATPGRPLAVLVWLTFAAFVSVADSMGGRGTTPLAEVMCVRLVPVLAGRVVITSPKAELPGEQEGRCWPFSLGAAASAVLPFLA